VQYQSSAATAIAASGSARRVGVDTGSRAASHQRATRAMNAGSTITSRDSHDVRHIVAARHARSGRPRWRNDDARPMTRSTIATNRLARTNDGVHRHASEERNGESDDEPWPAPAAVVKTTTENAGFIGAARWTPDRRRRDGRRARIALIATVSVRRCAGDRGDAPRQVLVRRPRLPFRHQRIAATFADRARDLRTRILDVAEQARAGRARLDARRLAVVGRQGRVLERSTQSVHLVITWRDSSISRAPYGHAHAQYLQPMHLS
jgi:hypothetical protein